MNDHETLLASARTLREIATAFGDWTRSADTARLDELIRLRRATWLGALLAARSIATFEATERSAAIVHRLIARDLRSAQREIGELLDCAFAAGGIVATATATTRKRREAERVRDAAITAIANDGTVRDVRGDVAALLACADDLERMLATSAEIATLDPAAVNRAVCAALAKRARRARILELVAVRAFLGDDAQGVLPSDRSLDESERRALTRAIKDGLFERRATSPLLVALSAELRADIARELRST